MRVYGAISAPKKPGDAGFDLAVVEPRVIFAGQSHLIATDVQVELPAGMCALVVPRSSLNAKGIFCQVGLIDEGYRGKIGVMLHNSTSIPYDLRKGDRIAQLLILPFAVPALAFVESPDLLSTTERGANGFGSTGT